MKHTYNDRRRQTRRIHDFKIRGKSGPVSIVNDAPYHGDVHYAVDGFTISTIQEYDEYGRGVKTTQRGSDSLTTFTAYTYDILGRQVTASDALGNTTSYEYDGLGRKIAETNAEGGTTTYAYDSVGRLASLTDPENNTTYYAYNVYGNVVSEAIIVDGVLLERTFDYDAAGNPGQTPPPSTKSSNWPS